MYASTDSYSEDKSHMEWAQTNLTEMKCIPNLL